MRININRWSPDTCNCVIDFQYDADLPSDQMVFTVHQIISQCQYHQNMGAAAHYDKVKEENIKKNKTLGILLDNAKSVTKEVTNEDGTKVNDFKTKDEISWRYDDNRKLWIKSKSITNSDKTLVKTLIDAQFGVGKVDFE